MNIYIRGTRYYYLACIQSFFFLHRKSLTNDKWNLTLTYLTLYLRFIFRILIAYSKYIDTYIKYKYFFFQKSSVFIYTVVFCLHMHIMQILMQEKICSLKYVLVCICFVHCMEKLKSFRYLGILCMQTAT